MGNLIPQRCRRQPPPSSAPVTKPMDQVVMRLKTQLDKEGNTIFTIPERSYTITANGEFLPRIKSKQDVYNRIHELATPKN